MHGVFPDNSLFGILVMVLTDGVFAMYSASSQHL